jgi:hypothetical protein
MYRRDDVRALAESASGEAVGGQAPFVGVGTSRGEDELDAARADADEAGELGKLEPAGRLGKLGGSAPGFDVAGIRPVRQAVEERPQFAPAP